MEQVLQKIILDQAQGILIVPCWKRQLWFTVLESVAVKWLDLPRDSVVFQSVHGRPLSQRRSWTTRAVVFNGFGLSRTLSRSIRDWNVYDPCHADLGILRQVLRTDFEDSILLPGLDHVGYDVQSVIESTEEHPEAKPFIQALQKEYDDVLHQVALAKDVDPEIRGP
jgi:hypothetical protein